jgi:hypothetical protein
MHFTVEKISPIIFATSVNFTKTTQSKQTPNRRKFAQSGHPGANPIIESFNSRIAKIYNIVGNFEEKMFSSF